MKPRSDKDIIKKFEEIDKLFDKISNENKQELENAKIKPIHPTLFPYSQNGIISFIAPMGAVKSYNYTKKRKFLYKNKCFFNYLKCVIY